MSANLQFLFGAWHITHSNFPMWLTGGKTNPILNYAATRKPGVIEDVVTFTEHGRQKSIKGIDVVRAQPLAFEWRGHGLLRLLKSRWKVEYVDPAQAWMILSFEKTLLTPAGHDMASRHAQISPEQQAEMEARFKELFPLTEIFRLTASPVAQVRSRGA